MKYLVKSGREYLVDIDKSQNQLNQFSIKVNGVNHSVEIKEFYTNGSIKTLIVDKQVIPVEILKQADGFPRTVILNGLPFDIEIEKVKTSSISKKQVDRKISGEIKSGLPGQIHFILVKPGDAVQEGQPVVILESMKMENEILSPKNGIVADVEVSVGQIVKKNDLIMRLT
jgi:glutaconyl-CoA/methylmalonyl-CoA decarboxylase subunit gamma